MKNGYNYNPQKANLPKKVIARKDTIIDVYRRITGTYSIPKEKQYWTLCAYQPDEEGAEINQMVKEGLLTKKQFHGVDSTKVCIKCNKKCHPGAKWIHGKWNEAIKYCKNYNPALIYLDTIYMAGHSNAIKIALDTIKSPCQTGTILVINVILTDYHRGIQWPIKVFMNNLNQAMSPLQRECWKFYPVENSKKACYTYQSSMAKMGTYILVKKESR